MATKQHINAKQPLQPRQTANKKIREKSNPESCQTEAEDIGHKTAHERKAAAAAATDSQAMVTKNRKEKNNSQSRTLTTRNYLKSPAWAAMATKFSESQTHHTTGRTRELMRQPITPQITVSPHHRQNTLLARRSQAEHTVATKQHINAKQPLQPRQTAKPWSQKNEERKKSNSESHQTETEDTGHKTAHERKQPLLPRQRGQPWIGAGVCKVCVEFLVRVG